MSSSSDSSDSSSSSGTKEERAMVAKGTEMHLLVPGWMEKQGTHCVPEQVFLNHSLGSPMPQPVEQQMHPPWPVHGGARAGMGQGGSGGCAEFQGECFNCGERGHRSRDCPKPRRQGAFPPCPHCGLTLHKADFCFELDANEDRKPANLRSRKVSSDQPTVQAEN